MKFWISWYHKDIFGEFELHSPWWISGYSDDGESICVAIIANSTEEAKEIIYKAYDNRPEDIEFRFITIMNDNWSPFNSRFKQAEWMKWQD